MTNVAENRINLLEEVKELRDKEKKHCDAMWTAKEEKRLTEARLDEANKKIEKGEATWKAERDNWEKEKNRLEMANSSAEIAKPDAEAKVIQIQADMDWIKFKFNTVEAQLKKAEAQ